MQLGSQVCAVRSTRVLVGEHVGPAVVVIKCGKIHQILPHGGLTEESACEVSLLSVLSVAGDSPGIFQLCSVLAGVGCGRQRGDAGPCRLPRTCERTGSDHLGGVLERHEGCCCWRGDNHCGHAAVSGKPPLQKENKVHYPGVNVAE